MMSNCPECGKPLYTALETGQQACSDINCRYAHGFPTDDDIAQVVKEAKEWREAFDRMTKPMERWPRGA